MISDRSARRPLEPWPYRAYLGIVVALCLAGLTISVSLAVSHYRVHTDQGYQSFCALSKTVNCDTVSSSAYAVLWGLPVAVWGLAGYGFLLILVGLTIGDPPAGRPTWAFVVPISALFSLSSLVFAGISTFKIGSYCLLCVATYAINFFLVYMGWIIRRRNGSQSFRPALIASLRFLWLKRRVSLPAITAFAATFLTVLIWFPAYWDAPPPAVALRAKTGVTAKGHPWVGAEHPLLEIVEFSDYQCFQCRKMHHYLRQLVARHPEKIRLVHRNYPMDHEFNPIVGEPFHVGSGQMALLAIHAAASGKFLEVNDLLFHWVTNLQKIRLAEMAERTGLDPQLLAAALQHEPYRQHLLNDIRDGMRLGIVGTPSYLINGRVYEGSIPAEILEPLIEVASSN